MTHSLANSNTQPATASSNAYNKLLYCNVGNVQFTHKQQRGLWWHPALA